MRVLLFFVCVPQFYNLLYHRILQEVKGQSLLKKFLFHRLLAFSHFCNEHLGWNPGKPLLFSHSQGVSAPASDFLVWGERTLTEKFPSTCGTSDLPSYRPTA